MRMARALKTANFAFLNFDLIPSSLDLGTMVAGRTIIGRAKKGHPLGTSSGPVDDARSDRLNSLTALGATRRREMPECDEACRGGSGSRKLLSKLSRDLRDFYSVTFRRKKLSTVDFPHCTIW